MKKKCKNEKDENCEKTYVQIFARPSTYFVRSSLIFRRGVSFGLGMNELFCTLKVFARHLKVDIPIDSW